ncbi:MAG: Stk1 family PASTA domain-containing Ser/Thr kinase [Lachnospiraceae bacterium]|nr:Stk1 family PASTA domain-containing Ser/Thr kinase [Lachnospiraceae bacterium]
MNRVGIVLAGRYELVELLGSGGMADVYKASDRKLNRYVAVKVLRHEYSSDESFITRFQQEAMAAASIQNPYVVNVYDVGVENDINYIVMELAEGITLKEYIQKKGKLEIIESINIAMQIVNGIREAHAHGIIHRDIKPQNVMVSSDGRIKVMDFGIAKAVTAQTITANTVGSVHYISPEQARGSACDERCDIYSIGITMYEMITGRVPFDGDSTVAIALAHIKEPITPPSVYEPMIPVSLEKIILKCTQKKPEQRYASADELIDDLKKALMTPDEDFVKEVVISQEGGTRIFSEEDTRKIKEEAGKNTASIKSQEEEDYQLGIEEDLEEEQEEETESDGKMEKVVFAIGIGALLVVVLIAGLLLAHAFNLFPSSGKPGSETVPIASDSLSEDETRMPSIERRTEEEAIKLLEEAELKYTIKKQADDDIEEGLVISASEKAGAVLAKDTEVTVYVSSGKNPVNIPRSILGKTEKAATKALEALGLLVKVEHGDSEVDAGYVYDCSPGVDQQVKKGETVTIYVSLGSNEVEVPVPNIVNQTLELAKSMLKDANLSEGEISYEFSDRDYGTVLRQNPAGGVKLKEGSSVDIVVSKGPETVYVKVPYLINMTKDEAESALEAEGLKLGSVDEEYDDNVEAGKVISQSKSADTEVEENESIDIVISKGRKIIQSEVPQIIGLSESEARQKLSENGLVGECLGEKESDRPEGEVIEVTIDAGSMVDTGTTVGYYISSGKGTDESSEQ